MEQKVDEKVDQPVEEKAAQEQQAQPQAVAPALTWPADWLAILPKKVELGQLRRTKDLREQWKRHEDVIAKPGFSYYQLLDDVFGGAMVWRFSSRPTKELLFFKDIKLIDDKAELITGLIKTLGRHTGMNIKDDENIRLQSFSRNLGSFMATAVSIDGDPNVKNAIHKSKYLCCVSIADAARRGVSAHPSLAKNVPKRQ